MVLRVRPSVTTQVDAGVQMTHSVSCVQLAYSNLAENVFQSAPLMTQESKNEVFFYSMQGKASNQSIEVAQL